MTPLSSSQAKSKQRFVIPSVAEGSIRDTNTMNESNNKGMITENEKELARHCIAYALEHGASQARVSLGKSVLDTFMMLNGTLDKVTRCADSSIYIYLFVDGRYGTYSTNRLDRKSLEEFVDKAIDSTRMLAEDTCRRLPDYERTAKDAVSGYEAGLYDPLWQEMTSERKRSLALKGTIFNSLKSNDRYTVISEECEYSDSIDDSFIADSQGFEGRHTETSFAFWSEMTIEDRKGNKYSGYWWESSPKFADISIDGCSEKALEKAVKQIGPKKGRSGSMKMILDNCVSSRVISPILSALNAGAIQQKNSFLEDSLGRQIFPEELSLTDLARSHGEPGARLFDTEGVATYDHAVIEKGVVKEYFVNTYMAGKLGMAPTIEGISRPVLEPFIKGKVLLSEKNEINLQAIMEFCGDGVLVTGFNGGNCNPTTGDFSYGVEGFMFKDGRITHPVKEMVITGNMLRLWSSVIAAGNDARKGARWQIPTLAFDNVDFSA